MSEELKNNDLSRLKPGDYVIHFKHIDTSDIHGPIDPNNYIYKIIAIGTSTDDVEKKYVIYKPVFKSIYECRDDCRPDKTWVRDYDEFMSDLSEKGLPGYRFTKVSEEYVEKKLKLSDEWYRNDLDFEIEQRR